MFESTDMIRAWFRDTNKHTHTHTHTHTELTCKIFFAFDLVLQQFGNIFMTE